MKIAEAVYVRGWLKMPRSDTRNGVQMSPLNCKRKRMIKNYTSLIQEYKGVVSSYRRSTHILLHNCLGLQNKQNDKQASEINMDKFVTAHSKIHKSLLVNYTVTR